MSIYSSSSSSQSELRTVSSSSDVILPHLELHISVYSRPAFRQQHASSVNLRLRAHERSSRTSSGERLEPSHMNSIAEELTRSIHVHEGKVCQGTLL